MSARTRLLLVALLVCGGSAAAPAHAAEGLFMTWNDCALGASSAHDFQQACSSNLGGQSLVCAFRVPFPLDSVLGVELVVDLQHSEAFLPDWWRFDAGACRSGSLVAGFTFPQPPSCVDFFTGRAFGDVQGYYLTEPRGGDNQVRIKVAASMLPSTGYAQLDTASMYYAARLSIDNVLTAGAATCPGCLQPACLVLNSIWVRRQPGAAGGDVLLSVPGPNDANWATWQGGTGANCTAVPVRSMTWGQVKGLYR
jgi:hypothetical protein